MDASAPDRRRLELADVFRAHAEHLDGLRPEHRRVVRAITSCRTAALGGHVRTCDHCGHQEISYNSCGDRHCPKCQGLSEARWVEARKAELLPVEYFHLVFTLPADLNPIFLSHPRVAYAALFAATAETVAEVARNPEHLGARVGFTAVLHTWTQQLLYHPHIHMIVPGGGLAPDGSRWIAARPGFFLPVRVLSKVFRGKLLSKLERAIRRGRIRLGQGEPATLLRAAAAKEWVVYAKPPLAGPQQVIAYLGRYTHRIAISNDRLISMEGDQVSFRWKDRAHGNAPRVMTLDAAEFLRRFLLHVLPSGFMRIRHYGFLANATRKRDLARCRQLLGQLPLESSETTHTWDQLLLRLTGKDVLRCPRCKIGRLRPTQILQPQSPAWPLPGRGDAA